jgi:hypothetical protein
MSTILQIIWTIIGAFLSVILTRLLIQNGRAIREVGEKMDERTEKLSAQIRETSERISELIVTEVRETRELIKALKG